MIQITPYFCLHIMTIKGMEHAYILVLLNSKRGLIKKLINNGTLISYIVGFTMWNYSGDKCRTFIHF